MSVAGVIEFSSASSFLAQVVALLTDADRHLVLDFRELAFMDSSAVRVLVGLAQRMNRRGGRLVIAGLPGGWHRRFEMLGLAPLIEVFLSIDEGLAAATRIQSDVGEPGS